MSVADLPTSREPAVVAICLDWLHDTLPWPRAPRWTATTSSGFATPTGTSSSAAWRECEQCGGKGKTKLGRCPNCHGLGGWHYDPMDNRRTSLRSTTDAHPEPDRPAHMSNHVVTALSSTVEVELEEHRDEYPPALQALADALAELRRVDRYERAVLQRVHVIRIDPLPTLRPAERALYDAALEHLAGLLPDGFRAPRWAREKAAA
jgi:hypothetical protein